MAMMQKSRRIGKQEVLVYGVMSEGNDAEERRRRCVGR